MSDAASRPPGQSMKEACFVVKDGAGQKLAYVYFDNPRAAPRTAHPRRGAADRGQYRQAAGAVA